VDFSHVIFVTGTNGKSTLNNLLYRILTQNGYRVIANLAAPTCSTRAASCLIDGSDRYGNITADFILIEVDERSFPYIIEQLPGKNIVITNIMQDQVHRNGDPDFIYQLLRKNMPDDMMMFLNNDEPRSKSFEDLASDVRYFGVSKNTQSYQKDGPYDVTMPCPYCFERIEFEFLNSANIGRFFCTACSFRSSETFLTEAERIDFQEKRLKYGIRIIRCRTMRPSCCTTTPQQVRLRMKSD
jgi:UDP-N-acetylmuramyl tripeptide synthase